MTYDRWAMPGRLDTKKAPPLKMDLARVKAMTDEDVRAAARRDPDCLPATKADLGRARRVALVKHVRLLLGLSQAEFAERFGFSLTTIRNWSNASTNPTCPSGSSCA